MRLKRSQQKRITREAQVLRYMRLTRGLSLNEAASRVRISGSAIAHIEQGRMGVSLARARTLVVAYGFTWAEFMEYLDGKVLPVNHRDECLRMIEAIDESKVLAIYQVLVSFTAGR